LLSSSLVMSRSAVRVRSSALFFGLPKPNYPLGLFPISLPRGYCRSQSVQCWIKGFEEGTPDGEDAALRYPEIDRASIVRRPKQNSAALPTHATPRKARRLVSFMSIPFILVLLSAAYCCTSSFVVPTRPKPAPCPSPLVQYSSHHLSLLLSSGDRGLVASPLVRGVQSANGRL
jgi:hypothetical protein